MPAKLYRCLNPKCPGKSRKPRVRDFEAETPVCPICTAGKDDPRGVKQIVPVHYLANTPLSVGPIKTSAGGRMVGCLPNSNKIPKHATGLAKAVTCPRCLASDILKQHVADKVDQHIPFVESIADGQPVPVKNITKVPVRGVSPIRPVRRPGRR
jgi:hypothetical protein